VVDSVPSSEPSSLRGAFNNFPAWAPDGSRVAYVVVGQAGGQPQTTLWVVYTAGSEPKPLFEAGTELFIDGRSVVWSPDGARLAFAARSMILGRWASQIYLIWADGSGLIAVTDPNLERFAPTWSPDSRTLVYMAQDGQITDLYSVKIDEAFTTVEGLTTRRLTVTGQEQNPRWQP
jgi:Tol biopolymer transport system component